MNAKSYLISQCHNLCSILISVAMGVTSSQTYFPTHQNQGYQPLQSVSALSYGLKLRHFTEYSVSWSTT